MKKLLSVLITIVLYGSIYAQDQLVMDPNAEARTLTGSFTAIQVSGGIDLYLSQSTENAVAVSAAHDKHKAGIMTVVENNVLKIYYQGEKGINLKNRNLRVYVSFRSIHSLDASGASDVIFADKITANSFDIQLSGASDLKGNVAVGTLRLNLSGASDVQIGGTVDHLEITSSGASDVSGFGLVAQTCVASASGASDINITVVKELDANASGSSDITYGGAAVLKEANKTNSGNIRRRG